MERIITQDQPVIEFFILFLNVQILKAISDTDLEGKRFWNIGRLKLHTMGLL